MTLQIIMTTDFETVKIKINFANIIVIDYCLIKAIFC